MSRSNCQRQQPWLKHSHYSQQVKKVNSAMLIGHFWPICRLCRCVANNGSVPLYELDVESLSAWWEQRTGERDKLAADDIETGWICRFCLALNSEDGKSLEKVEATYGPTFQPTVAHAGKAESLIHLPAEELPILPPDCKRVECTQCGVSFQNMHTLKIHSKRFHCQLKPSKGKKLKKGFEGRVRTRKRSQPFWIKEVAGIVSCTLCSRSFSEEAGLRAHMKRYHPQVAFKCTHFKCSYILKSKKLLKDHLKMFHDPKDDKSAIPLLAVSDKETCPQCSKVFETAFLPNHQQLKSCKVCKEQFTCFEKLKKHRKGCKLNLTCNICSQEFSMNFLLVNHMKKKHEPARKIKEEDKSQWECKDCSKMYASNSRYRQHRKKYHPVGGRIKLTCDLCKNVLASRCGLVWHMYTTHKFKKPICECFKCGKQFAYRSQYKQHLNLSHDNWYKERYPVN